VFKIECMQIRRRGPNTGGWVWNCWCAEAPYGQQRALPVPRTTMAEHPLQSESCRALFIINNGKARATIFVETGPARSFKA